MAAAYALAGEEHQRINPFLDLVAAAEKIEQGRGGDVKPAPKQRVAAQNEQSYSLIGQMLSGVQGRKPRTGK